MSHNATPHSGSKLHDPQHLTQPKDFSAEESYWRQNHGKADYANPEDRFDDYAPAYRTGYEGRSQFAGQRFEDAEPQLRKSYETAKGSSHLGWEKAKAAVRSAWDRVERALPGDADHDGK